jgi:hypothetical protein
MTFPTGRIRRFVLTAWPGILSTVKGARVLIAVVLAGAACASGRPAIEQRTTEGPLAEELWFYRVAEMNGREPSFDERRRWESQLDLAVTRYLAKDQAFANSPQLSTFRFLRQASVGMSKEQVVILLGDPERVTRDEAEMQALATRYWPMIRGKATEAWVYPLGWRLFFAESHLVDITQFQPR